MNTFKRKWNLFAALLWAAILAAFLGGCATADKRYATLVQDTNDRIERVRKAEAEADSALAKALEVAAAQQPALVAAVASNVMMARALRGAGANGQAFVAPERPRSFSEEARAWVSAIAPFLVAGYQANRTAAVQIRASEYDFRRFEAAQTGETARVQALADMAIGLRPTAPNVTTVTNTFGRDGLVGGGTQQNDNSDRRVTTCTAGSGAAGGAGGSGGAGGGTTGSGAPGAQGSPGGSGGDAC